MPLETLVIDLAGTARERGRAQGEQCRSQIGDLVERQRTWLSTAVSLSPSTAAEAFRRWHNFFESCQLWAPELLEEVQGIAEGAALGFNDIFDLQLLDEQWNFAEEFRALRISTDKCSAFAACVGGKLVSGQNMDLPRYMDGSQVVLRTKPAEEFPRSLVFSATGMLALNGINKTGLSICCNTLSELKFSNSGLPVAFIVRKVLELPSVAEASYFLRNIKHASGQNYLLCDGNSMASIECSASTTAELIEQSPGRLVHTNHALSNVDRRSEPFHSANSRARLQSLADRICSPGGLCLNDLIAALSAADDPENPVCRTYGDEDDASKTFTFGSLIFESGTTLAMRVAPGPPASTPYTELHL